MRGDLKIMVGVPVADSVGGLFVGFFGSILLGFARMGFYVGHSVSDKVPLDAARRDILKSCLQSKVDYDYLLWIDSDMFLTDQDALTLIKYLEENPDIDAATGMYVKKAKPFNPVCYHMLTDPKTGDYTFKMFIPINSEPTDIDGFGFGCVAMRVKSIKEKLVPMVPDGKFFWFDDRYGEDLHFCALMKKAGMKMVLLPSVSVMHQGAAVAFDPTFWGLQPDLFKMKHDGYI